MNRVIPLGGSFLRPKLARKTTRFCAVMISQRAVSPSIVYQPSRCFSDENKIKNNKIDMSMFEQTEAKGGNLIKDLMQSFSPSELKLGDDLPPMLHQNAELVHAAAELLTTATEIESELEEADMDCITAVMDMLFSTQYVPLIHQFTLAMQLLMRRKLKANKKIYDCSMKIIEALVPSHLYGFISEVDWFQLSEEKREMYEVFVMKLLSGRCTDEDLISEIKRIDENIPEFFQLTGFVNLLQNLGPTMDRTRLYHLITKTCEAFDPEQTGTIKVADLEESLGKVLSPEEAKKMLGGVEPDEEGKIFYPQLAHLLLKGAPSGEDSS